MSFPLWKRGLSYFYPILVKSIKSGVSGTLELSLQNGKLVVDSETANYSFGSLHNVFQKVIKEFVFFKDRREVLILGFGAGSIAEILNVERDLNLNLTGIELDPAMITIYEEFFRKEAHQVDLFESDALLFLAKTQQKFDCIFIDVFENLNLPEDIKSKNFLDALDNVSHGNTQIAMNTMIPEKDSFVELFLEQFGAGSCFRKIDIDNLVLFRKLRQ